MAAPMRSGHPQDGQGHRARVADSCKGATAARGPHQPSAGQPQQHQPNQPAATAANFEYDDNEWDIGIGDLIIDLDADIEKTNEQQQPVHGTGANMAANTGSGPQASKTAATAKMHIEHSATADKGLKMKIKRTKPGTKTSEAKHEIVKSNEQNGVPDGADVTKGSAAVPTGSKHAPASAATPLGASGTLTTNNSNQNSQSSAPVSTSSGKRGSSGHRRDKTSRDKHVHNSSSSAGSVSPLTTSNSSSSSSSSDKQLPKTSGSASPSTMSGVLLPTPSDMNGLLRAASAPQTGPPRSVFPASTGPGPPPPSPGPPASPAAATAQGSAAKPEQSKVGVSGSGSGAGNVSAGGAVVISAGLGANNGPDEQLRTNSSDSPTPSKKSKLSDCKETADVCVGTSVGTITEPDCLGPCEPGTSVTLEGIVWHETEGGVLVVNVTWRGKTYVGTLLDCTRHDWAPPRFCDSPTSDLDSRTPKGRETRSSVHSKLRNGGAKGGRRGVANGTGPVNAPASPTPFVPPRPDNKRKSRAGEDEASPVSSKKSKIAAPSVSAPVTTAPVAACPSPPPSPLLLECPEPNCSKKYKHINGLKYHQTHAHGSADDEDTKDLTSMSENDESNIEAPSPVTPVKSPDKCQDSPVSTPVKKDSGLTESLASGSSAEAPSTPPSPATPPIAHEIPPAVIVCSPSGPLAADAAPAAKPQAVVKPAILRFTAPTPAEEYASVPTAGVGIFAHAVKPQMPAGPQLATPTLLTTRTGISAPPPAEPTGLPSDSLAPQSFAAQLQTHVTLGTSPQFSQPPNIIIPTQPPNAQLSPTSPTQTVKLTPFKVKPTSALMPDEKKQAPPPLQNQNGAKSSFKKKNRKSPSDSPHLSPADPPVFGMEQSGRDEVQSPAYSDISDDGAPVDSDVDKAKNPDKKTESAQALPHMSQYGIYPYFTQPHQYVVPNQQQPQLETASKPKEPEKEKPPNDKDKKETVDYPPQKMLQQHYYPYQYMPGYPYNMDPNYGNVPMQPDDKHKEDSRVKESPSPIESPVKAGVDVVKVSMASKPKQNEHASKDKHQNDNHQIIKESIEMKNQMSPYLYSRQPQQPPQPQHHGHREEEARRYYVYEQQRRKEHQQHQSEHKQGSNPQKIPASPTMKTKDIKLEEKKEKDVKQEGVKPTMETQGPPPPPTSQYAYIHPSYMQGPHYGTLPFDPSHPMYRGIMVPGPYSSNPYLHPQMPRYHAPEDLSRAQPPSKALDMLQHHAQYYSSHKIHELQERAIKSPTPKASTASSSPSTNVPAAGQSPAQMSAPPTTQASSTTTASGKQTPSDNSKESRSPPPQRHVHTHHHTHVGLGYPIYGAGPYGAAVLASQQAAAVTVINPYPTK